MQQDSLLCATKSMFADAYQFELGLPLVELVSRRKTISPPPRSRASCAPRLLRAYLRFPKKRERKGLFCKVW